MLLDCNFSITRDWPSSSSSWQNARVRGREWEEWPADTRARQEEQSLGRERQVHNHVIGANSGGRAAEEEGSVHINREEDEPIVHPRQRESQTEIAKGKRRWTERKRRKCPWTSALVRSWIYSIVEMTVDRPPKWRIWLWVDLVIDSLIKNRALADRLPDSILSGLLFHRAACGFDANSRFVSFYEV